MPKPNAMCLFGSRVMSSRSGSGNCAGSRLAAPMHIVMRASGGSVTPPTVASQRRDPVAQLVRALEAQEFLDRRLDDGRVAEIRDQPRLLLRPLGQRMQRVADQVGRGLVAGVEQEDALVHQLGLGQPLASFAFLSPWISRVSTSVSGSRRMRAAIARPARPGRRASRAPRRCLRSRARGVSTGSSAPRIASDQPRSGPRSSCGTPSRLPMISIGIAAAKSSIEIDLALAPPSRRAARRRALPVRAPSPRCAAATARRGSAAARACAAAGR